MNNKIIPINDDKIVEDRLELNFKDTINYFSASVKGVISAIINDDASNIIILKNNDNLEIKGQSISKIEFIRDADNCILAKVRYCTTIGNSVV